MQFINYFLASLVSFSGLLIGILLVKIAPEEQKPLARYFELARKSILILISFFLIFYFQNNAAYVAALLVCIIFVILAEISFRSLWKKSVIIYAALGLTFYLSSKNLSLFAVQSSLILLYGIPTASILYRKKENNHIQIFLYNLGFIAAAGLAFLIATIFHF